VLILESFQPPLELLLGESAGRIMSSAGIFPEVCICVKRDLIYWQKRPKP
jgi:hypothetical protein